MRRANHQGDRGGFALDAMQLGISNRRGSYVLARSDWRGVVSAKFPGTTQKAASIDDAALAQHIFSVADEGLVFQTARDLADWNCARRNIAKLRSYWPISARLPSTGKFDKRPYAVDGTTSRSNITSVRQLLIFSDN